jgi:homoserine kinase
VPRPAFRGGAAHVRVPATSANLGPGFDALGLALDLHDDVLAVVGEDGIVVDVAGEGTDDVARDEKNLVVRAMRATFDELGGQPRGIELSCANRIPHGRGLGSSAAAIVAGVLLARSLVLGGEQALPMSGVLNLAARLEGHPDNVAACLLGGLTIAWATSPHRAEAVRVDLDPQISPFVFVPPTSSSTHAARQALPDMVSRADAVHNLGRSSLLISALSGTARTASDAPQPQGDTDDDAVAAVTVPADVLLAATDDRLHQQYRRAAMTGSGDLIAALRAERIAAVMSGAGPTVLAFTRTPAEVEAATAAVPADWSGWAIAVDLVGAHLVPAQR